MGYITIQDNVCWSCGKGNVKLTTHHGIPQHLKPKQNVTIPICEECHKKINSFDLSGMFAFAYKIEKLGTETRRAARVLTSTVRDYVNDSQK